jgi:K+-transporting ATPase KdpF subunit
LLATGKVCGKNYALIDALANYKHCSDLEVIMETLYWISGIIAAGLLVYLVIALLKPEIFS